MLVFQEYESVLKLNTRFILAYFNELLLTWYLFICLPAELRECACIIKHNVKILHTRWFYFRHIISINCKDPFTFVFFKDVNMVSDHFIEKIWRNKSTHKLDSSIVTILRSNMTVTFLLLCNFCRDVTTNVCWYGFHFALPAFTVNLGQR